MASKQFTIRFCITALLLASGVCGLLSAVPFAAARAWLDSLAGDGSADPYTPALHARVRGALIVAGSLSLVAAGVLFAARGRLGDALSRIGPRWRRDLSRLTVTMRALVHRYAVEICVVACAAILLRLPYLDQPMRFDESYTYLHYSGRGLVFVLATYDDPNNHVFHSLLVWLSTRVLGDDPWAIRLPAFLAGVLLAPATMLLARTVAGRAAGWFAGLLVATSSPLIEYSTNARGYTLLALLTVLAWQLAVTLMRRDNLTGWWLLAIVLALGAWTIPVMLYPAAMLVTWIVLRAPSSGPLRRRLVMRRLCLTTAAALLLTLLLYAPILLVGGFSRLAGNEFVAPLTWESYAAGFVAAASDGAGLLFRDVPVGAMLLLGACFAAGLLSGAERLRRARRLAAGSVLICLLLTAVQRVLPPSRVWLFLLPLASVLVAAGCTRLTALLQRSSRRAFAGGALALVIALWPAVRMIENRSVLRSTETGVCPDAERIIRGLAPTLRPGEPILAIAPVSAPLVYYADRQSVPREHFAPLDAQRDPAAHAVAIVSRTEPQTLGEVLIALGAPAGMTPQSFERVGRYPSADMYRRNP